ncbi:hypothetical protein CRYUN_Cryun26dG0087400 [Craigia yunnanensis]
MGGVCSRKRDEQVVEDGMQRGLSGRYGKSGSSKWLVTSFLRSMVVHQPGAAICPSLMELCIDKICKDVWLGEYPGVQDSWMDIISSQGTSLLSVDLSGSDVTDTGFGLLKECSSLQALTFNHCENISEIGLMHISGLMNLTSLSFKKSDAITAEGMRAFSNLVNLEMLDLERCSGIYGGFVHIKGLSKLESLNIRYCQCITDWDLKAISGLNNLKELQISNSNITDFELSYLRGLRKLIMLNLEGCNVTAACLDSISALVTLAYLNLGRCGLTDDGCDKFSGVKNLKVLSLAFNNITDACLAHLKGLTNLENLNLDSCKIGDECLANLTGLSCLKSLELSDTEIGSNGLRHLSAINDTVSLILFETYLPVRIDSSGDLESIITLVTDSGLKKLSGLTALKSLNLDARQFTDAGLSALTSFKNLHSLEICGGGLTDAGLKNIKDLASLTLLNLSQNCNLTNKSLELISGLTAVVSLNVSNSHISNDGLPFLKLLKNLRSLSLESCKETASEIKKLQSTVFPILSAFDQNDAGATVTYAVNRCYQLEMALYNSASVY